MPPHLWAHHLHRPARIGPLPQRLILQSNPLSLRTGAPSGGDLIRTAGLNLTPFQTVIWAMSVGQRIKGMSFT